MDGWMGNVSNRMDCLMLALLQFGSWFSRFVDRNAKHEGHCEILSRGGTIYIF